MAPVVNLCSLGNKALAAFLATATDNVTTILCGHTGAESVLALPNSFGGLVGPFHWILAGMLGRKFLLFTGSRRKWTVN